MKKKRQYQKQTAIQHIVAHHDSGATLAAENDRRWFREHPGHTHFTRPFIHNKVDVVEHPEYKAKLTHIKWVSVFRLNALENARAFAEVEEPNEKFYPLVTTEEWEHKNSVPVERDNRS